jgi:putative ATPase
MQPLAERMRPTSLEQYIGQEHLVGKGAVLRRAVEAGRIPSFILWGPPGVGKTTLAQIIAQSLKVPFYALSAINAGVKDIREVIDSAKKQNFFDRPSPVLFIDEIHRFSKSQQDALLGAVEKGWVTLIGATTENPSFEVISALLSRCQVYVLKALQKEQLVAIVEQALSHDFWLKEKQIVVEEYEAMLRLSGGDARKLLNILELVAQQASATPPLRLTNDLVMAQVQEHIALYDKGGEQHYDIISAFIKSLRGSDPQAALYWLARMLVGGESIEFIARRMLILAAEDIGLANPNALLMAQTCFESIRVVGMPEARIILSQTVIYLAASPKSNAAYQAINQAMEEAKRTAHLPVPLHLRNAPTDLMKSLDYGKNYQYAHDFPGNFAQEEFMPASLEGKMFFRPQANSAEEKMKERLQALWKDKYKY